MDFGFSDILSPVGGGGETDPIQGIYNWADSSSFTDIINKGYGDLTGWTDTVETMEEQARLVREAGEKAASAQEQVAADVSSSLAPYTKGAQQSYMKLAGQVGLGSEQNYMDTQMAKGLMEDYARAQAFEDERVKRGLAIAMPEIKQMQAGEGMLYSGDTMKDIVDYAQKYRQDIDSPDIYREYMNALGGMSGQGQQTLLNLGQLQMASQQAAGKFRTGATESAGQTETDAATIIPYQAGETGEDIMGIFSGPSFGGGG